MVLLNLFVTYGPWAWMVVGLVLLALELVVPAATSCGSARPAS